MLKKLLAFLFFVSFSCVPMETMGQDLKSIGKKAENAIRSKHSDWELVAKDESDNQLVYNWKSARGGIRILIFQGSSSKEAADKMATNIKFLPAGPGKRRNDLGNEGYSWKDSKGFAGVRFRQGNVFVDIVASPALMAEEMARELMRVLKKK